MALRKLDRRGVRWGVLGVAAAVTVAALLGTVWAPSAQTQTQTHDQIHEMHDHGAHGTQIATAPVETDKVTIDNFSFTPVEIQVKAGTTITWTNQDDIPHTVVSDAKAFKSGVLDTDDSFSFKFDTPGDYVYFCSVHPKMTGHIKVMPYGGLRGRFGETSKAPRPQCGRGGSSGEGPLRALANLGPVPVRGMTRRSKPPRRLRKLCRSGTGLLAALADFLRPCRSALDGRSGFLQRRILIQQFVEYGAETIEFGRLRRVARRALPQDLDVEQETLSIGGS
jgi:plastocyanin